MSDALPLPPSPRIDHYRTLARELQDACQRDTVREFAEAWMRRLSKHITRPGESAHVARAAEWIERSWRQLRERHKLTGCKLADARFFLARAHGFVSWPRFVEHLDALARPSKTAAFEAAVDAIVSGDLDELQRLLRKHPDLIRMRSMREHQSTLLHYVSANGVEDVRQRTPQNIVAITRLLLDAGADPNAESEAYGGHSTTLGLTATSLHPEKAGVQIDLLHLLLARGANIEQRGQAGNGHGAVVGSLANGQGEAARFLADRGAVLDLEGAAGVGRVDVLRTYVADDGRLLAGTTPEHLASALQYACGYGREEAVRFLLDRGADPRRSSAAGETPLHWTTYGPHDRVAALLLERGARADARDERWHATPLDWLLHKWVHGYNSDQRQRGYDLVARLIAAGSVPDFSRVADPDLAVLNPDARLMALLGRE